MLSLEEQKIIEYGRTQGKNQNEIMDALTKFRIQNPPKSEEGVSGLSEIGVDIAETLGGYTTTLKSTGEKIVDIATSKKPLAEKAVGIGAETFRGVGRSIGELVIGAAKIALPEKAERTIEKGITKVGEKVGESKFVQNLVEKYQKLSPETKEQVNNALGFAEGLAEIGTGGAVSRTGKRILGKGVEISEEAIEQGIKKTARGIEGITPRALKNTYQRINPIDRDRIVKVQAEAIRDSFFKDRPVVNRKFDELLKDIARKDKTITQEKFISDFVNEGFMPRVEGRLARFDHVIDDIVQRQGTIAESLTPILKFVPQQTKLSELKRSAERILRTSPQIGVELNKSLKELDNFIGSLGTRYGDDLSAVEVNEIRKQMNRYTNAFEGELFMQDTADALADATRKRLDEIVPSGSVKTANAEIGRLMEFKKLARILDNRQIDIPIFGSQFGRLMGTLVASGIGVSVAGPGGLVIAGAAAFLGGEVIAQGLRELRFNPRIRNLIIQGIKRDEQLVQRLISEVEGENKIMLQRLLLPEKASEGPIITPPPTTFEPPASKIIPKASEAAATPKTAVLSKELESLAVEARKYKSAEEFEQFLTSGKSLQEVQKRFRAITGESRFAGGKIAKGMGEAQGESFARMPTKQEIADFYNQVVKKK